MRHIQNVNFGWPQPLVKIAYGLVPRRTPSFAFLLSPVRHKEFRRNRSMTAPGWVEVLGAVAGFCTTFAFVPQLVKIYKQGGRDLSYGMLSLYLGGVLMWLAYALQIHAQALILTNAATAM